MKRIGRIGTKPLADLADKAALLYCELSRPELYALTLSPEGYLAIERATEAAEDDVIGHYNPNAYRIPRWTSLSKAMCADLEHEINVLRRGQLTHS
jgi:hypothetical protein